MFAFSEYNSQPNIGALEHLDPMPGPISRLPRLEGWNRRSRLGGAWHGTSPPTEDSWLWLLRLGFRRRAFGSECPELLLQCPHSLLCCPPGFRLGIGVFHCCPSALGPRTRELLRGLSELRRGTAALFRWPPPLQFFQIPSNSSPVSGSLHTSTVAPSGWWLRNSSPNTRLRSQPPCAALATGCTGR